MERPEILIVEDDDDTRMVLQDLLELSGFIVRTCPDARRALDAARERLPSLMLVDYYMPDADGAFVVRSLREEGLKVPVVLTTGANEGREQAARLGIPSIEKPYDVNRLLQLVRSLVPEA